jgi:hypothetical protein
MPLEGIPTAGGERQDAARALNCPRNLSERCLNSSLRNAVDDGKLIGRQLSLHDIIDKGEGLAGSSTLSVFISSSVMAARTLSVQSIGIALAPPSVSVSYPHSYI